MNSKYNCWRLHTTNLVVYRLEEKLLALKRAASFEQTQTKQGGIEARWVCACLHQIAQARSTMPKLHNMTKSLELEKVEFFEDAIKSTL